MAGEPVRAGGRKRTKCVGEVYRIRAIAHRKYAMGRQDTYPSRSSRHALPGEQSCVVLRTPQERGGSSVTAVPTSDCNALKETVMTHSHRRHGAGLVAVVACALLTACSNSATHNVAVASSADGPPSTAAPAAPSDSPTVAAGAATACSVLTEQDVSSALGGDPGVGNLDTRAKGSSCAYGGTLALSVNVTLVAAKGKAAFDYAKTADPGSGDTVVDVPGVGDGAFGILSPTGASVEFYKGDRFVSVLVSSTQGDAGTAPKDKALALAKVAAGRA